MNRTDLQRLSRLRLSEATSLLASHHASGAYYLAGYASECALKACIAKTTVKYSFPDRDLANRSYTHNLRVLLVLAELDQRINFDSTSQPELAIKWNTVQAWTEASRYRIISVAEAEEMLGAVGGKNGVMRWIARYW